MDQASTICFSLETQEMRGPSPGLGEDREEDSGENGDNAMTTSSSIRVKPLCTLAAFNFVLLGYWHVGQLRSRGTKLKAARVHKGFTLHRAARRHRHYRHSRRYPLPGLRQGPGKARAISCVSNEKQIVLAWSMYTQDYDETVLPYSSTGISRRLRFP